MNSNRYSYTRMALIVLSFFCVTMLAIVPAHAQNRPPRIDSITYKGNVFVVSNMGDTVEMLDPVTGEIETIISNPYPIPVKMNAMNIYAKGDVEIAPSITADMLNRQIIQSLANRFTKLADGEYRLLLSNVIVSDKGKIVYYNFDGIEIRTSRKITGNNNASKNAKQEVSKIEWNKVNSLGTLKIDNIIDKIPAYKPATVYNNAVPYRFADEELQQSFYIRAGVVSYTK